MTLAPRLGYGAKLGLSHVLLVIAVGAVVMLLVARQLETDLVSELDARLEAQARGAATWVSEGRHPDKLAARLGGIVGAHVTIFDASGRVLGDSDPSVSETRDASRDPEVLAAIEGKLGRVSRASFGVETRFVAIPAGAGALRLGESMEGIAATVHQVRLRLAAGSALGILLAVFLSALASGLASRPLRKMSAAARDIADGNYAVVLAGQSPDEFGELERSLSVLASRLAEDRERIERLEMTRRDFVANVSHELRTPITAIQGYAETLLRGTADAETSRRFLETMHRQAERVGVLVSDLLRLAALEARMPQDSPATDVKLADVVRQAVMTVRESRPEGTTRISVDVRDDLTVRANAAGLEQVVENLVENAVRHGGGADVRVTANGSEGRTFIRVEDDGHGIATEHLTRVFERFYRVDPGRSRTAGGTGLGLAIVKHLVESMGGTVSAESELGKGAAFVVELDRVADRGETVTS